MWNQFFPERASTIAYDVDLIFSVVLGLSLFFAVPVALLVVFFAVRYRRGVPRERFEHVHEGRGGSETWRLEAGWIAFLLILALSVFSWGARIYFKIYAMPATGMDVYVVGKQWMWKFQHPTGQTEIDELHVPVNFPVRLTMISEDVIHSFFVPAFRVKRDVVPGQYTTVWFEATETGTYHLFCAEFCGTDHSRMVARVVVMEATAYQNWLSQHGIGGGASVVPESMAGDGSGSGDGAPSSMADAGEQLFANLGCASCHRAAGGGAGPSLVGLWGKQVELENGQTVSADINYVRRSILDPQAEIVEGYPPIMPTYTGQIDEAELLTLVEYIQSLGATPAQGESASGTAPEEEQE
jgi:cytochrome c oxidase subunit 2